MRRMRLRIRRMRLHIPRKSVVVSVVAALAVFAVFAVVIVLNVLISRPSGSPPATLAVTTATQTAQAVSGSTPSPTPNTVTPNTGPVTIAARNARRGDELFLSSVDLSPSDYQTMTIRRVSDSPVDVTIELGGVGGGGWNASENRIRLVLPLDYPIIVQPR